MKLMLTLLLIFVSAPSWANNFAFNSLSQGDVDNIFKEFAATFSHSTVTGASSHSKVFGFELGLLAGVTETEHIKKLVKETLPPGSDEVEYIPFATLYALVSLPMGITSEVNYTPKVDLDGVEFNHLSVAGKWELTSLVDLPVSVAFRGFVINTDLAVEQTTTGLATYSGNVDFHQTQMGLQVIVGKKMPILEPYASIGILKADGELETRASGGSIFVDLSSRKESKATSLQAVAGLQVNLLLVKTGIEYVNSFGTNHVNAKFAFSF